MILRLKNLFIPFTIIFNTSSVYYFIFTYYLGSRHNIKMKIINWKGLFGYKLDFPVHLCSDVLLELLRFGTRCNLVRIEPVGRRFHRLIELHLRKAPFLLLNMQLTIRSDSGVWTIDRKTIGRQRKISRGGQSVAKGKSVAVDNRSLKDDQSQTIGR